MLLSLHGAARSDNSMVVINNKCGEVYIYFFKKNWSRFFAHFIERKYYKEQGSFYVIDYKHIIHALIKKPGALRYCQYRNEIFPNNNYRRIWDYLDRTETTKIAPKIILRLLKLAADYNCEAELGVYVCKLLENKTPLIIEEIENQFNANKPHIPEIESKQHDLSRYDLYIYDNTIGGIDATT